jgi:hypothetical protein
MDKKIAGLLGAAAALTTVGGVQAATPQGAELAPAANYADLLQPVPNPVEALKADDARRGETAGVQVAQVSVQIGHHHHHHHHHHVIVVHHHHHHHHPAVVIVPGH